LGDSSSVGSAWYSNWDRPYENCKASRYFLERLDTWKQGKHWKTIIFNCGIHDIYIGVPIEEYKANLRTIIHRLHADHIYFCNTTPGRPEEPRAKPDTIDRYNAAALEVMRAEKIRVIDLYGPAMAHREWWKKDLHYTPEGYSNMAKIVSEAVHD